MLNHRLATSLSMTQFTNYSLLCLFEKFLNIILHFINNFLPLLIFDIIFSFFAKIYWSALRWSNKFQVLIHRLLAPTMVAKFVMWRWILDGWDVSLSFQWLSAREVMLICVIIVVCLPGHFNFWDELTTDTNTISILIVNWWFRALLDAIWRLEDATLVDLLVFKWLHVSLTHHFLFYRVVLLVKFIRVKSTRRLLCLQLAYFLIHRFVHSASIVGTQSWLEFCCPTRDKELVCSLHSAVSFIG